MWFDIHVQYMQLLLEDYQSVADYVDYIQRVEVQYNETMNSHPNCDYCVRFRDVKQKTKQLKTKIEALVSDILFHSTASRTKFNPLCYSPEIFNST